jgi:hypothetical protein
VPEIKTAKTFGASELIPLHIYSKTSVLYRHELMIDIEETVTSAGGFSIFRAQLASWLLANMQMKEPNRFQATAARMLPALTLKFIQKVRC